MPPEITPGRSLWLRLLHVIEQREDHIHQVNSLIRRLGSHGILTDQYLLGPIIRFGTVEAGTSELMDPVVYRSAIHTLQGFGAVVVNAYHKPSPSANEWECVSAHSNDKFVSFFQWRTLIRARLFECLIAHLRHMEHEIAKTYLPR